MIPPLTNELITLVKSSSLLSAIAALELTHAGQLIIARTFAPFEIYAAVALIYLVMVSVLSRASALLEKCLEIYEKHHGADSLETAAVLRDLATAHRINRANQKAAPLLHRCLEVYEKQLGKEHLETQVLVSDLAWLRLEAGKYDEAIRELEVLDSRASGSLHRG